MAELELVPIHTRILTHHDNIVEAIKEYAGDRSRTTTSCAPRNLW